MPKVDVSLSECCLPEFRLYFENHFGEKRTAENFHLNPYGEF